MSQEISENTIETLKILLEDICSLAERVDSEEAIEIQDLAGKALEVLVHPESPFISNEDALDFNDPDYWSIEDGNEEDDGRDA